MCVIYKPPHFIVINLIILPMFCDQTLLSRGWHCYCILGRSDVQTMRPAILAAVFCSFAVCLNKYRDSKLRRDRFLLLSFQLTVYCHPIFRRSVARTSARVVKLYVNK